MTLRHLLWSLVILALAGCVGATPYGPASGSRDDGYSETQLGDGRWQVAVSANASTDRGTVERHLLRRAAELTLENGADRFVMVGHAVTPVTIFVPVIAAYPRPSLLFDHRSARYRHGQGRRDDRFDWRREERLARLREGRSAQRRYARDWAGGQVLAPERPVTRWRASAEVLLLSGMAGGEEGARDAREILAELGGTD
jgi:hypothetical protein